MAPRSAWARLAALAASVGAVVALVASTGSMSADDVHDVVDPLGVAAPIAFIAISSLLICAMVPIPLLAVAGSMLFSTAVGTAATIIASTGGSVTAFLIARYVAGDAATALSKGRLHRAQRWIEARGFVAVLYTRIAPLPVSLVSYVAGLTRVRLPSFAGATALGVAPRVYAYTALSGNLDDLRSPEAITAGILLLSMILLGLALVTRERIIRRVDRRPAISIDAVPTARALGAGRHETH